MYEIKAYHCSYCRKYGMAKAWIKKHEEKCFHNPITRSCMTCANFDKKTLRHEGEIYSMEMPVCYENFSLFNNDGKWMLKNNCEKWVERPDDEEILFLYQAEKEKDQQQLTSILLTSNTPF